MIFSIICEELGLVGASLIILLFLILIWRFFVIATHAKDLTGALIATGAMAHIDDSGDLEYCGCDEQYSQYRDHAPLYQLWGNFGGISAVGNGACVKCV